MVHRNIIMGCWGLYLNWFLLVQPFEHPTIILGEPTKRELNVE